MEYWISANEKTPAEKIYLTDSHSGQLIPRAENIYVNLFNESGEAVSQSVLLSVNGTVSGNFSLF